MRTDCVFNCGRKAEIHGDICLLCRIVLDMKMAEKKFDAYIEMFQEAKELNTPLEKRRRKK